MRGVVFSSRRIHLEQGLFVEHCHLLPNSKMYIRVFLEATSPIAVCLDENPSPELIHHFIRMYGEPFEIRSTLTAIDFLWDDLKGR